MLDASMARNSYVRGFPTGEVQSVAATSIVVSSIPLSGVTATEPPEGRRTVVIRDTVYPVAPPVSAVALHSKS